MLKLLFLFNLFAFNFAFAGGYKTDLDHDELYEKFVVHENDNGGSIEFYEGEKLRATFDDLIVYSAGFDSSFVTSPTGGAYFVIETTASRLKYKSVIPIYKSKNTLYLKCAYNSVFDSVNLVSSAGEYCIEGERLKLSRESLERFIVGKGQKVFSQISLKKAPNLKSCAKLEVAQLNTYGLVRCYNKNDDVVEHHVVDLSTDTTLLTFKNVDLVPASDGKGFAVITEGNVGLSVIKGNFACLEEISNLNSNISGGGVLGKSSVTYDLKKGDGCYKGKYQYEKYKKPIALAGSEVEGMTYLFEMSGNTEYVAGAFLLKDLSPSSILGVWISLPLQKKFAVSSK